jgi:phage-related holin
LILERVIVFLLVILAITHAIDSLFLRNDILDNNTIFEYKNATFFKYVFPLKNKKKKIIA